MQEYLYGLECPLEEEVAAVERAVEASLAAATAARAAAGAADGRGAAAPLAAAAPAGESAPQRSSAAAGVAGSGAGSADAAASAAVVRAAHAMGAAKLPAGSGAAPTAPVYGRKSMGSGDCRATVGARNGLKGAGRSAHSKRGTATANGAGSQAGGGATQTSAVGAMSAGADVAMAAAAKAAQAMANVTVADGPRPGAAAAQQRGAPAVQPTASTAAAAAAAAAAAQAAAAMTSAPARAPPAATTIALERKLAKCVYACVAEFDRAAVSKAFAAAQRAAGLASEQSAKPEQHVTLWHKSSANRERGRACVAADGEKITFEVSGFDVSGRISAARVRKLEPQQPPQHAAVGTLQKALEVPAPHITLWLASGACPQGFTATYHHETFAGILNNARASSDRYPTSILELKSSDFPPIYSGRETRGATAGPLMLVAVPRYPIIAVPNNSGT